MPLVRYWLSVFKIPYSVLFPSILFFCCIGTYSVNNNLDDIFITAAFGFIGYMFLRLDLDAAPLMLGFILGPDAGRELPPRAAARAAAASASSSTRPISGTLLALIAVFIVWQLVAFFIKTRKGPAVAPPVPGHEVEAGALNPPDYWTEKKPGPWGPGFFSCSAA